MVPNWLVFLGMHNVHTCVARTASTLTLYSSIISNACSGLTSPPYGKKVEASCSRIQHGVPRGPDSRTMVTFHVLSWYEHRQARCPFLSCIGKKLRDPSLQRGLTMRVSVTRKCVRPHNRHQPGSTEHRPDVNARPFRHKDQQTPKGP